MEVHVTAGLIISKTVVKTENVIRPVYNIIVESSVENLSAPKPEDFKCFHSFLDHAFQHLSGVTATLASAKGQLKTQMLEILNLFLYYVVLTLQALSCLD